MFDFQTYSIRQKLIAMGLWAAGGALVLAAAAFMAYDFMTYRSTLVDSLSTLGEIINLNASSSVVFNDSASAAKTLATLKARSSIVSACIYTPDGKQFAAWQRDPQVPLTLPPLPSSLKETFQFHRGSLTLYHPMILDKTPIGGIYLESDLSALAGRLKRYAVIAGAVLVISLLVAGSIAFQVGQKISSPLLHLAEVAKAISEKKDYSVRAEGGGPDEVGLLIRTFNDMLTKIQQEGKALQKAHNELELRVQERTAQLTAANKELEAFSYSVSHDLRAPLRHIGGFTDLLSKLPALQGNATAARYVTILNDSVRQMGALIDDLLSFSRMGRADMLKSRVNLGWMLGEIIDGLKQQTEGRAVEWKVGTLPEVHGDPAMLHVVWVNLLSNALKYSRGRNPAVIEVGVSDSSNKETVFFVRDNGAGFDMKYIDKLFGVFQRLHSADDFEGTGIGLATVRRIIQRHGGRVWAEGAVDQGATFYVALPEA